MFMTGRPPEEERLQELYPRNQERLLRIAAGILGPGPRAEGHFDQLRSRSEDRLNAWLMVVVKHNALDALRKEKREAPLPETWEHPAPEGEGEFYALVAIIRGMPEEYRRVLELRFVAEWSLADIAAELGLTEGAVKTRIFRGRKLLIRTLKREGYLDGWAIV